jgi:hypothetical protein
MTFTTADIRDLTGKTAAATGARFRTRVRPADKDPSTC